MLRSTPTDMRKALELTEALKQAGILFVPIPVLSKEDSDELLTKLEGRLEVLAEEAEEVE